MSTKKTTRVPGTSRTTEDAPESWDDAAEKALEVDPEPMAEPAEKAESFHHLAEKRAEAVAKAPPAPAGTSSEDPVLRAVAARPLGIDGHTVAAQLGLELSAAYTKLNQLLDEGLLRRNDVLYQPTPLGTLRASGQG